MRVRVCVCACIRNRAEKRKKGDKMLRKQRGRKRNDDERKKIGGIGEGG